MKHFRIILFSVILCLFGGFQFILGFTPKYSTRRPKSFIFHSVNKGIQDVPATQPNVSIKYCVGCKWGLRSSWLQQELLSTFNESNLGSVSLVPCRPPEPAGQFIVKVDNQVVWDRKIDGGFPEAKVLKQKVRDIIEPSKDLGHSDVSRSTTNLSTPTTVPVCLECEEKEKRSSDAAKASDASVTIDGNIDGQKFDIRIEYCTGCKWMLRANYLQMELFATFHDHITSVTLIPIRPPAPGGIFKITLNNDIMWDRTVDGGFPETKVLKQRVRDVIDPQRNLGHSDRQRNSDVIEVASLSDEESQEMRGYFGVM